MILLPLTVSTAALLLALAIADSTPNCSTPPLNSYLYCNPDAPTEARVADLVPRILPEEFPALVANTGAGVPRLGVPGFNFGESLHGTLVSCGASFTNATTGYTSSGCPTSFPHLLLLGSTLNRSLWGAVASAISDEDRGLHNQAGLAASIFWSPNVNEVRDPRWGRNQEVPGEDPTLTAEFAFRYVTGLERGGPDDRYKKIVATCKHFSAYDMENSDGTSRAYFDANVSRKDLVEFFWPAFRSCVQRGHVGSIMCSYNAVNGIPSCANGAFNNGIVRAQWGWDGFFVSDCAAVQEIKTTHHYVLTWDGAIRAALHEGGVDTSCGSTYPDHMLAAYNHSAISLGDMRAGAANLLRQVFSLGLLDPPDRVPYNNYGPERVDTPAHRQLALEAALQGIVLLQNNASAASPNGPGTPLLPLQRARLAGKKVAVVGPNAAATQTLLSNFHGSNTLVNNQSILLALQRQGAAAGFEVEYAPGCVDGTGPGANVSIACQTTAGFPAALAAVNSSAVAIVVVGWCADDCPSPQDANIREAEGNDRVNITLPGQQDALVQAVFATDVPTVAVLVHGGALAIDWMEAHIAAILDAHYPGEMGGDAVAAILFGDVSPSGREVTTTYPAAFASQRRVIDMQLAPHTAPDGHTTIPGVTYLYYDGPTLFPFGWGLSYTTFAYAWFDSAAAHQSIDASAWATGAATPPAYAVNVTNTGAVTSDVAVMAFYSTGLPGEPLQELFDFQRAATLAPGATVTLHFSLPAEVAATVDTSGKMELTPGRYSVRIGDVSRRPESGQCGADATCVAGTLEITLAPDASLESTLLADYWGSALEGRV